MAKKFVKISLATKFRLLFGAAVLGVIAAALVVPWYFIDLLADQNIQRPGAELTRLRYNEWLRNHPSGPGIYSDATSSVVALFSAGEKAAGREGPLFIKINPDLSAERPLDPPARQALKALLRQPDQRLAVMRTEDPSGSNIYRCFRSVRAESQCLQCHGPSEPVERQFQLGQLVGLIDAALPASAAVGDSSGLVWWTRGAFVIGGALAGTLALVLFAIITQRLVLRPVRKLTAVADKVAEGDLTVRSTIGTNDELERLGESFNEMLEAISDQHEKLKAANRALDLKLSELAEANVSLFHANQVKTEFLANISHELRTPLNSIMGFADLVAAGSDERTKRYGQNIASASRDLLNMINDLLDLAKIEAGKAQVRIDKVSVSDTCQTLSALMKPLADKKQLDLTVSIADDLPIIMTDAGKFQQVLYNLLSNAIKFTPAGGNVGVTARKDTMVSQDGEMPAISVSISDSGPGIPEAEQQHIFEKFYQADRPLTKESAGTGLGLAISKELMNLLGGRMSLKSSPGHGAVFTIVLPVERP